MRRLSALLPLALAAACVPASAPPPPPTAAPTPPPAAAPAPPPPPIAADWRDWAFTPGDWTYRAAGGGSTATFGTSGAAPALTLACDGGQVAMTVPGVRLSSVAIRTTSVTKAYPANATGDGTVVTFASGDPILDAMGFSRGRFVVEGGGTRIVLPSWAEVLRVTEDCRR